MGLFGFGKKRKARQEAKRLEELKRQQEKVAAKRQEEEAKVAAEAVEKPVVEEQASLDEVTKVTPKKVVKKPVAKKMDPKKPDTSKEGKPEDYEGKCGKYEIFPEAELFKYRLKASNGEILVVSLGYSSRKGAKNGVVTFQNAVIAGNFEIVTDKAGFTHFDLFGTRGARVIAYGEYYKTVKQAEKAVEAVKKYSRCTNIVDLKELPAAEVREFVVEKQDIDLKETGKYQLYKEDSKSFFVKLLASNGQVLLVSQRYASKQSASNGIESIKKAIGNQNFTIEKDKQNRFQFNIYTANKQLLISGESYPQKANCQKAIQSVIRFGTLAKVVEL